MVLTSLKLSFIIFAIWELFRFWIVDPYIPFDLSFFEGSQLADTITEHLYAILIVQ